MTLPEEDNVSGKVPDSGSDPLETIATPGQAPSPARESRKLPDLLQVCRALLEIILCSGLLTGLNAVLLLRWSGVPDHSILTQSRYLALLGGLEAVQVLFLIGIFLRWNRQSLVLLTGNFRRWRQEALLGLSLVPLLLGSNLLLGFLFEQYFPPWHSETNPILELVRTPGDLALFLFIGLAVGGIKEEVQRAFILQRFRDDLAIPGFGLVAWSLLFGYGHLLQGVDSATGATLFGLIFGFCFLWRKNLIASMIAHCLYNSFILIGYWYWGWA